MNLQNAILLPCRPSDSLKWALEGLEEEKSLLWHFDLGLNTPYFPLDDSLHFQALQLALQQFTQQVWPRFQEKTQGAILYKGSAHFDLCFHWSDKQKENYEIWEKDKPKLSPAQLRRLFCADAFAHYFQLLAHALPDDLPLYLLLDATGPGSLGEKHQLISKERFEHFSLAVKELEHWSGAVWKKDRIEDAALCSDALCFPEEEALTEAILERLSGWMEQRTSPFRVIPEAFLTEEWEGVDSLHVLRSHLSPQGKRKLLGFEAAGGTVFDLIL